LSHNITVLAADYRLRQAGTRPLRNAGIAGSYWVSGTLAVGTTDSSRADLG